MEGRLNDVPRQRVRWHYVLMVPVLVAFGMFWRSGLLPLPRFAFKYGGDAIWAMMVFVGCGFLFPRLSTMRLALLALGIAWAVEFSQIYHAPWIDAVRSTRLGRLALGFTFNWPDLLAYAAGIGIIAVLEHRYRKSQP